MNAGELRTFICQVAFLDESEVQKETKLLSSGLVDSLRLIDIVGFVEKKSNKKVGPLDLNLDNFDSIEKILNYLNK